MGVASTSSLEVRRSSVLALTVSSAGELDDKDMGDQASCSTDLCLPALSYLHRCSQVGQQQEAGPPSAGRWVLEAGPLSTGRRGLEAGPPSSGRRVLEAGPPVGTGTSSDWFVTQV